MVVFSISSYSEIGMYCGIGLGIYAFFFLLGFGFSALITFKECQKTQASRNAIEGSIWALYPTIAWFLIRPLEFIRAHFDRFYRGLDSSTGSKERAGWISIGYILTLACIAGIYSLSSSSIADVCVPDIDEATRFKEEMIKRQQDKVKASQETTPALKPV